MRNPLAGKVAKFLYRNSDGSTVLQVEDEHDEILVTVEEDGTMFEERWTGVAGVREAWLAAASHFNPMLVPDAVTGRKSWQRLESKPEPVAAPTPAPAPAPEPEPIPAPAPVSVSGDPQYEPWKAPRESELTRGMAWGPGWDL